MIPDSKSFDFLGLVAILNGNQALKQVKIAILWILRVDSSDNDTGDCNFQQMIHCLAPEL